MLYIWLPEWLLSWPPLMRQISSNRGITCYNRVLVWLYIYSLLLPNLVLFIADPPTDGRCQLSTRGITLVRWADSGQRSKKGFASVSASIAVAVVFGFDSTDSCWSASNLVLLLLVMCNLEYHLSINILYFRGIKGMNLSSYKFDP